MRAGFLPKKCTCSLHISPRDSQQPIGAQRQHLCLVRQSPGFPSGASGAVGPGIWAVLRSDGWNTRPARSSDPRQITAQEIFCGCREWNRAFVGWACIMPFEGSVSPVIIWSINITLGNLARLPSKLVNVCFTRTRVLSHIDQTLWVAYSDEQSLS
jgi:hypothetical protein